MLSRLDPIDDSSAAGIEERIGPRLRHPFGPGSLRSIDHVSREVREQEEERSPEQPLEGTEPAAERPVEGTQQRMPPGLPTDRSGENFYENEARHEQDS